MLRKRIYQAAAAIVPALAAVALTAGTASALTGPTVPTKEEAGYQVTGAQFAGIHGTVYLRNAAQYSASVAGLGQSVQLWGGGKVFVLGVSNGTVSGPYSPAVAVFNSTTHALICSTANATCPDVPASWTSGAANVPTGHYVRISAFYTTATGVILFTVADTTAGTATSYSYDAGTGISFKQARLGSEYGNDPWSAPPFTAPAGQQKVAAFTSAGITNYLGKSFSLTGYWTTSPLAMTGAGSVVEADAGPPDVTGSSFNTYLEP